MVVITYYPSEVPTSVRVSGGKEKAPDKQNQSDAIFRTDIGRHSWTPGTGMRDTKEHLFEVIITTSIHPIYYL
jgi:hypothetical protein